MTDVDTTTGRNLVDSMTNEVVVKDDRIRRMVPFEPMGYDDAVRTALKERADRADDTRRRIAGGRRPPGPGALAEAVPPSGAARPGRDGGRPQPPSADRGRGRRRRGGSAGRLAERRAGLQALLLADRSPGRHVDRRCGRVRTTHLGWIKSRDNNLRRPIVTPVATGVAGLRCVLRRRPRGAEIPVLNRAIGNVLRYADEGNMPLIILTTSVNGLAEEMFFRGAFYTAAADRPILISTTAYTVATTAAATRPHGRGWGDGAAVRYAAAGLRWHPGADADPPHLGDAHAPVPATVVRAVHPPGGDPGVTPSVLWFRRDLRLRDHPALDAAADAGPVCALFVLDDVLLKVDGGPRTAYLYRSLRALDEDLRSHGGRLTVKRGRPEDVVPSAGQGDRRRRGPRRGLRALRQGARPPRREGPRRRATGADREPVCGGARPGAEEGRRAVQGLHPFFRAWSERGWHSPSTSNPARISWHPADGIDIPQDPKATAQLPDAGEAAALAAWKEFLNGDVERYNAERNRPDLDSTSHMSVHLKFGEIHPRTMLADLGRRGPAYRRQLCWRDFYAQVLHHWPHSAHGYFQPAMARMRYDTGKRSRRAVRSLEAGANRLPDRRRRDAPAPRHRLDAQPGPDDRRVLPGQGPAPEVDAGRPPLHGAPRRRRPREQPARLAVDGGDGHRPGSYFRIFNPTMQAKKLDPDGDYVRRWVSELEVIVRQGDPRALDARRPAEDYPAPIVDHDTERRESLARYQDLWAG